MIDKEAIQERRRKLLEQHGKVEDDHGGNDSSGDNERKEEPQTATMSSATRLRYVPFIDKCDLCPAVDVRVHSACLGGHFFCFDCAVHGPTCPVPSCRSHSIAIALSPTAVSTASPLEQVPAAPATALTTGPPPEKKRKSQSTHARGVVTADTTTLSGGSSSASLCYDKADEDDVRKFFETWRVGQIHGHSYEAGRLMDARSIFIIFTVYVNNNLQQTIAIDQAANRKLFNSFVQQFKRNESFLRTSHTTKKGNQYNLL